MSYIRGCINFIYKIFEILLLRISVLFFSAIVKIKFFLNNLENGTVTALGLPILRISRGSKVIIKDGFYIRSYCKYTDTGENRPSKIIVARGAKLTIGKNVGISSTTIVCQQSIEIGDNVLIGGGCNIFDTNFHPVDCKERLDPCTSNCGKKAPIVILDNVFIGTSCIIGKGVTIGENSVIAAGSVVVKNVPSNEIWGGNPAKFIRKINE